jgi:hypothetical protein
MSRLIFGEPASPCRAQSLPKQTCGAPVIMRMRKARAFLRFVLSHAWDA